MDFPSVSQCDDTADFVPEVFVGNVPCPLMFQVYSYIYKEKFHFCQIYIYLVQEAKQSVRETKGNTLSSFLDFLPRSTCHSLILFICILVNKCRKTISNRYRNHCSKVVHFVEETGLSLKAKK